MILSSAVTEMMQKGVQMIRKMQFCAFLEARAGGAQCAIRIEYLLEALKAFLK